MLMDRIPTAAKIYHGQVVDVLDQYDKCLWHVNVSPYHAVAADVIKNALIVDLDDGYVQLYELNENNPPILRYMKDKNRTRANRMKAE